MIAPRISPWAQSLDGRAIDLLAPRVEDVDFREIARTLARLNRYAGASCVPVSVALHTLIACDAAAEADKPWVLLHDCHEARIGEITAPFRMALFAVIEQQSGGLLASLAAEAIATIELAQDRVIHAAAGLELPDDALRRRIRRADLVALVTERRDFLADPPRPWGSEIEALPPLERSYADLALNAPDLIARRLVERFHDHLPAFARHRPEDVPCPIP